MHPPSEEQQIIIDNVISGNNVIVDAVAGSGKTTTVMHLARQMPDKKFLLITYNSKLRLETRERCHSNKVKNVEVHTYHSYARKMDIKKYTTDEGIINYTNAPFKLRHRRAYDIIIFDEVQDMKPIFYKFATHIVRPFHQLVFLGDKWQCIYKFNGADSRFLLFANLIYKNRFNWAQCSLSTSYRVTNQMAAFINTCALRSNRLRAVRDGRRPMYVVCNVFDTDKLTHLVMTQVLTKYAPEDIFILAPSVKGSNAIIKNKRNGALRQAREKPIAKLVTSLSKKKVPIYVPISDNAELKDKVIDKKLVVSSIHQSKGLERKCVILYGFDRSYFKYNARDDDEHECNNPLYVALTRAKEQLIMIQSHKHGALKFLDEDLVKDHCEYIEIDAPLNEEDGPAMHDIIRQYNVTDLTNHLPTDIVMNLLGKVNYRNIKSEEEHLQICNVARQKYYKKIFYEDVSAINGTLIPIVYELQTTNKCSAYYNLMSRNLLDDIINSVGRWAKINKNIYERFIAGNEKIDYNTDLSLLAGLTNLYMCAKSGFYHQLIQIGKYDWLDEDTIALCMARINNLFGGLDDVAYEQYLEVEEGAWRAHGYADAISKKKNYMFEFKCKTELKYEDIVQVLLYYYIALREGVLDKERDHGYVLYNILTDEKIIMENLTLDVLHEIFMTILDVKTRANEYVNDEQFMAECKNYYNNICYDT